jgi:site-specific recombinase XerD
MAVRPLNAEKTRWQIDFYPSGEKGKRERMTFFGTEAEAAALELDIRRQYGRLDEQNPSIREVHVRWWGAQSMESAKSTNDDMKKCFKRRLLPFFGSILLSRITTEYIDIYKKRRLEEGVKKRTINKELAYLSAMLKWAFKKYKNEPQGFKIEYFKKVEKPVPIILHVTEVIALLVNLEMEYRAIFLLMYVCGLRISEALGLTAENVDLANNRIIARRKGGKVTSVLIITDVLREHLKLALRERKRGFLFLNQRTEKPFTTIRKALHRAANKAGITKRVYHHLLRHTFATHGLNSGVGMRAMQQLLNHANISTTEIYVHLADNFSANEAPKFESFFKTAYLAELEKESRRMESIGCIIDMGETIEYCI